MIDYPFLRSELERQDCSLLFATVSGEHLYGFPSTDSDYQVRGVHLLPSREAMGLLPKRETIEASVKRNGAQLQLVTHDALKFFSLLLNGNGCVMEDLYSPLVVQSCPEHQELKEVASGCITRQHCHHYHGLAKTQWELCKKEKLTRLAPLLSLYRVLLTGIHLLETGRVESNLARLSQEYRLAYVADLMAEKTGSREDVVLAAPQLDFHAAEYRRLVIRLEHVTASSRLPNEPSAQQGLNDLLVRLRLRG